MHCHNNPPFTNMNSQQATPFNTLLVKRKANDRPSGKAVFIARYIIDDDDVCTGDGFELLVAVIPRFNG
jgi:hypothetical protein